MPRQNRVTPWGEIAATPEQGTFMGNRGVLHDGEGRIKRAWQVKRWLLCLLHFKGRHRTVMRPGWYTELFFLDEATGLAAGHRPCAERRRDRFLAFCDAWIAGRNKRSNLPRPPAGAIDERLHAERLAMDGSKRTYLANLDELPDGVFVTHPDRRDEAFLIWNGWLLAWSPGEYRGWRPRPKGEQVSVLTPASTVGAIRAGYAPEVHPTAVLP